jgi:hypothetical protein
VAYRYNQAQLLLYAVETAGKERMFYAENPGFARTSRVPGVFIQTDRDMVLEEQHGQKTPVFLEKGGYLCVSEPGNIWGIAEDEFRRGYRRADCPKMVQQAKEAVHQAWTGLDGPEEMEELENEA